MLKSMDESAYGNVETVEKFGAFASGMDGEKALLYPFFAEIIAGSLKNEPRPTLVLDYGCGTGWLGPKLWSDFQVPSIGYDKSNVMVQKAEQALQMSTGTCPNVSFTSNWTDTQNKPFSHCFLNFVMPAVDFAGEVSEIFARIGAVLRPGGSLLVTICNPDNLQSAHSFYSVELPGKRLAEGETYTTRLKIGNDSLSVSDYFWPRAAIVREAGTASLFIRMISEVFHHETPADAFDRGSSYLIMRFIRGA